MRHPKLRPPLAQTLTLNFFTWCMTLLFLSSAWGASGANGTRSPDGSWSRDWFLESYASHMSQFGGVDTLTEVQTVREVLSEATGSADLSRFALNRVQQPSYFRSCYNMYGARWSGPFGSYDGSGILRIEEEIIPDDPPKTTEHPGDPWTKLHFHPEGNIDAPGLDSLGHPMYANYPNSGWDFGNSYSTLHLSLSFVSTELDGCQAVERWTYQNRGSNIQFLPASRETTCSRAVAPGSPSQACAERTGPLNCPQGYARPALWWSIEGNILLDARNPNAPVVYFADGSVEVFKNFRETQVTLEEHTQDLRVDRRIDRNGHELQYTYEGTNLQSVTDGQGRSTRYVYEFGSPHRPLEIITQGLSGRELKVSFEWANVSFDPDAVFPSVTCDLVRGKERLKADCPKVGLRVLKRVRLPDGRTYDMTYGAYGNLVSVQSPTGAVQEFEYGNATSSWNTFEVGPEACPEAINVVNAQRALKETLYPDGKKGTAPSQSVSYLHEGYQALSADILAYKPLECSQLRWFVEVHQDGKKLRRAQCVDDGDLQYSGGLAGKTFAEEVIDTTCPTPGCLLSATYYGNLGRIQYANVNKDYTLPAIGKGKGQFFANFEVRGTPGKAPPLSFYKNGHALSTYGQFLSSFRFTHIAHFNDGLWSWEAMEYRDDLHPIFGTVLANVTKHSLLDENGRPLQSSSTRYFHAVDYWNRNLISLPQETWSESEGVILSRTSLRYDDYGTEGLRRSDAKLDRSMNTVRGNVTSSISYLDPASPAQSTQYMSATEYWDTGDVFRSFSPVYSANREVASAETSPSYADCRQSRTLTQKTRTFVGLSSEVMSEAPAYETTAIIDCFTGAVLKTVGINGEVSCTQYDTLGRVLQVAGPGDSLTDNPQAIFEASCLGSVGPTSWFDYPTAGQNGHLHTVSHVKDKTQDGFVTRSFSDGLGRTIRTCSESVNVDEEPIVLGVSKNSSGKVIVGSDLREAAEFCTHTFFDGQGRAFATTSAFYKSGNFDVLDAVPQDVFLSKIRYDIQSRPVRTYVTRFSGLFDPEPPTARVVELGETSIQYSTGVYQGLPVRISKTTNGEGVSSKTFVDLQGRVLANKSQVSLETAHCQSNGGTTQCAGDIRCDYDASDKVAYCSTTFEYDPAGRVKTIIDAHSNRTEMKYDSFGRKIWMRDPDVGQTFYEYGVRGLLASSDWHEGQAMSLSRANYKRTTFYGYDLVGRLVVQDTPVQNNQAWVNGPDDDDQITYYDGFENQCYACNFQDGFCRLTQTCNENTFGL